MSKTPLNAYERETVIVFNDAEDTAQVTTHQRPVLRKLEANPAATKVEDLTFGSAPGARFELPKKYVRFGKPRQPLTDAERAHLRAVGYKTTRGSAASDGAEGDRGTRSSVR